jgi:glycerol-3-phosphate acyltransferase PlsX
MKKFKIIVDGFGGDNAPLAALEGCRLAADTFDNTEIIIVGNEHKLKQAATENKISLNNLQLVNAKDEITMNDEPVEITKSKNESSMAIGLKMLSDGLGDAFVSAGNTGALLVGATFIVKRIKGVKRAALASPIPTRKGYYILLDAGANVECRPEMLLQFGIMGSAYAKSIMNIDRPSIGLINVGTEEIKGTQAIQEAYKLFKNSSVNFVGNVEARELNNDACNVAVCDGFTGNIILKLTEGLSKTIMGLIKDSVMSSTKGKLGGVLIKSSLSILKDKMDYSEYGGVPLLGIAKPVFKAHGSSNAKAFKNAVREAIRFCENKVIDDIGSGISNYSAN